MQGNEVKGADGIIVGAGILGCATAYFLSCVRAGKVVLLERRLLAEANTSRGVKVSLRRPAVAEPESRLQAESVGLSRNWPLALPPPLTLVPSA